jgi:pimeloyl-ACP methyl ester carboxylesterase
MVDQFSTEVCAHDLLENLDKAGVDNPYLLGWSYGGRVALYIARHFPDRVRGICALGTNFEPERAIRAAVAFYDPNRPRSRPLPDHERKLFGVLHAWVLGRMGQPPEISEADMAAINLPVLVLSGAQDPLVPIDDAKTLYSLLRNARLVLFEGTVHPAKVMPLDVVRDHVLQFVRDVEAMTRAQAPDAPPSVAHS